MKLSVKIINKLNKYLDNFFSDGTDRVDEELKIIKKRIKAKYIDKTPPHTVYTEVERFDVDEYFQAILSFVPNWKRDNINHLVDYQLTVLHTLHISKQVSLEKYKSMEEQFMFEVYSKLEKLGV
jgi:hypothetical protein